MLLLKDGKEVPGWDKSKASVQLHLATQFMAKKNDTGAFAFWHSYATLKDSQWIVAYVYHSALFFLFNGIDIPTGSKLHAVDDVPN